MIYFEFYCQEKEIDGFSRGHITINGSRGSCTSKDHKPDQSMMIFLSMTLLLDGVRQFIIDNKSLNYNFVGVGCSFQFYIKKVEANAVVLNCDQQEIDTISVNEFTMALWVAINSMLSKYKGIQTFDEAIFKDLISSIENYKETFNFH